MEITNVQLKRLEGDGKVKALVTLTFDKVFVIHDIRLVDTEKGFLVAMPSKKVGEKEYRDIAHPIENKLREKITFAVLNAYTDSQSQSEIKD